MKRGFVEVERDLLVSGPLKQPLFTQHEVFIQHVKITETTRINKLEVTFVNLKPFKSFLKDSQS